MIVRAEKKVPAGIFALVLGGLGIHKFFLGYVKEGVVMLIGSAVLTFITCGTLSWVVPLIGFIEGIIYLTKSDAEFHATYEVRRKGWF